jgi:hypothetical protein
VGSTERRTAKAIVVEGGIVDDGSIHVDFGHGVVEIASAGTSDLGRGVLCEELVDGRERLVRR